MKAIFEEDGINVTTDEQDLCSNCDLIQDCPLAHALGNELVIPTAEDLNVTVCPLHCNNLTSEPLHIESIFDRFRIAFRILITGEY